MRKQGSTDRSAPDDDMTAARQRDAYTRVFDDIASVRDGGFEHATSNPERADLEAMHDAAGNPDEDDDSDPHPDSHACRTRRLRREQHERRMIAGERTGRRR
jgi:hypothetical protein